MLGSSPLASRALATGVAAAAALVSGSLAYTEPAPSDSYVFAGTIPISGTLAYTEPADPDTYAFAGTLPITGTFTHGEAIPPDSFAFTGAVSTVITGSFAFTEVFADTAFFIGYVDIFGDLAHLEDQPPDIPAFTGSVPIAGTFSHTEPVTPDIHAFTGAVTTPLAPDMSGSLRWREPPQNDDFTLTGTIPVSGSLAYTHAIPDVILIEQTPTSPTAISSISRVHLAPSIVRPVLTHIVPASRPHLWSHWKNRRE